MIEVVGVNDFATKGTKDTKQSATRQFCILLFVLFVPFVAKWIAESYAAKKATPARTGTLPALPAWVVDDSTSSRASEDRNFFALPRWCGRAK